MTRILLIFTFLCASVTGHAAENAISAMHFESYTAEFDYYELHEDGSLVKAGSWLDALEIGDDRILRTVTRKPLGTGVDLVRSVAADKHSLAPLYLNQRFGADLSGIYHTKLEDHQLTQVYIPDSRSPARIMSAPLSTGTIEVNLQGILAAALPFDFESQIEIKGYKGGLEPSVATLIFQVLGEDKVVIDDEAVSAWKVHERQSNWTYWVRKKPPYLVKVSHPAPGGKTLVSLLVSYEMS